jgi:HK97 family phage major capsid protein
LVSWCLPGNLQSAVAATAAAAETAIRRAVSLVEDANVGMVTPGWAMRASAKNWLAGLRDAAGYRVFPSIDDNGTLKGFPIYTSSQFPTNLGSGTNETEIVFADFSQVMIGDALNIVLAMSTEAATVTGGVTTSAFQTDQTLFRAVSEHDLAPENDVAISVIRGVNWAA